MNIHEVLYKVKYTDCAWPLDLGILIKAENEQQARLRAEIEISGKATCEWVKAHEARLVNS